MNEFGPTVKLSEEIHAEKYRSEGETFSDAMIRIANYLKDNDEHFEQCKNILLNMRFLPAGRIQSSCGSPRKVTPFNCFVMNTIEDSMESIMRVAYEAAMTMRMGGGVGYDFSTLRPRGDLITTLDSKSSGPVSFMKIYDAICGTISSAGHRRGAQMGVLRVDHPDIEEFVRAKQNSNNLTNFNISIGITDTFMNAVEAGTDFGLFFNEKLHKTIDARALWEEIMRSTWDWAEPGVLFIDRINAYNNLWYCEQIAATNPCVTGDTLVLTNTGYFPIRELIGKEVSVWNGNEWSKVTPFSTGFNSIMRVQFSDGAYLDCTPYHQFVLAGNVRVAADELKIGDRLEKFSMPVVETGVDYEIDAYSQGFYSGDGTTDYKYSWIYPEKYSCMSRLIGTISDEVPSSSRRTWRHGVMYDKRFVPVDGSLSYCVNWLAGVCDADATVTRDANGNGIQLTSVDRQFLLDIKLMLTRLGIRAKVCSGNEAGMRDMPDGKGGSKAYPCQTTYRLLIGNTDTHFLKTKLGFVTERLQIHSEEPQRDARRFVTVTNVQSCNIMDEETFCFTEPLNHTGTFNGIVTGNCAEQPLPPYGACLLGSFNLVKYLNDNKEFNYDQLQKDIYVVVRMMDNVIDSAVYPLEEQAKEAKNKRRMGLGVTGLANTIEAMGYSYASSEFLVIQARILETIRNNSYAASSDLAKEKGSFALFDTNKYLKGKFIKTLPLWIRDKIREQGIRNSHLTSIAPTGTISLTADNVSSGIEPVFMYSYTRTIRDFDTYNTETVEDYGYRNFGVKGKTTIDLSADDHLNVLITASQYVDSAVSKTCNINPKMSWEDFKNIYMKAWKNGCKGCTTFNPEGKRYGVLNMVKSEEDEGSACYIDPDTGNKSCE